jgi:hypothetical protein
MSAARSTTVMAMAEFIYQTRKARKAPTDKVILNDDTVNFGLGAEICVVGPNDVRTSSVPRICGKLTASMNQYRGS